MNKQARHTNASHVPLQMGVGNKGQGAAAAGRGWVIRRRAVPTAKAVAWLTVGCQWQRCPTTQGKARWAGTTGIEGCGCRVVAPACLEDKAAQCA